MKENEHLLPFPLFADRGLQTCPGPPHGELVGTHWPLLLPGSDLKCSGRTGSGGGEERGRRRRKRRKRRERREREGVCPQTPEAITGTAASQGKERGFGAALWPLRIALLPWGPPRGSHRQREVGGGQWAEGESGQDMEGLPSAKPVFKFSKKKQKKNHPSKTAATGVWLSPSSS